METVTINKQTGEVINEGYVPDKAFDEENRSPAERERLKQETQERAQAFWNAPETPESAEVIPDTPKAQTPLKNDHRSSEAYAGLRKAYNAQNEDGELTKETQWLLDRLGL